MPKTRTCGLLLHLHCTVHRCLAGSQSEDLLASNSELLVRAWQEASGQFVA